jgi:hypothetical protein
MFKSTRIYLFNCLEMEVRFEPLFKMVLVQALSLKGHNGMFIL